MRLTVFFLGMLLCTTELMAADFKATQLQREIGEVLNLSLGLELEPNGDLGEEYSFKVTEEAVRAMENLKASSIPIEIANTNKLAAKKSDALKGMGFIPRKSSPNDQETFRLDVTDVTIKILKGKTITVFADGTVKMKTSR